MSYVKYMSYVNYVTYVNYMSYVNFMGYVFSLNNLKRTWIALNVIFSF